MGSGLGLGDVFQVWVRGRVVDACDDARGLLLMGLRVGLGLGLGLALGLGLGLG